MSSYMENQSLAANPSDPSNNETTNARTVTNAPQPAVQMIVMAGGEESSRLTRFNGSTGEDYNLWKLRATKATQNAVRRNLLLSLFAVPKFLLGSNVHIHSEKSHVHCFHCQYTGSESGAPKLNAPDSEDSRTGGWTKFKQIVCR